MSLPAISVLMPAYNVEKYIGEAIDSILNQTFKDFEFIVVDDASTDKTLEVIERYTDPRIRIIKNEKNIKLAASLNKGLKIAKGKYIARMDADDISRPDRFQKLYDFLEKNPQVDICGSAMKVFGYEDTVWEYSSDDKEIKAGLLWKSTMAHGAVMMRLETILKHNLFYDETFLIGQDWKYWYDVKDHVTFSNLKEPLYLYRRDQQSVTIKFSHQSKDRYAKMHSIMLTDLGVNFSERELLLQQFIMGIFTIPVSPQAIKDAYGWSQKLVLHNRRTKKFDTAVFEKLSDQWWGQLFFKIIPLGFKNVFSYFSVSGMKANQLIYYFKTLLSNKK